VNASPIRLGVAGTGRVFERLYRPALERAEAVTLVAACDVRSPDAPLPPGVAFHDSLTEMLAGGGLDAVAVLTPPRLHAEQTQQVLKAGLRALVEKPVTMNLQALQGVLAEGTDLTPAFPRRYWPGYRAVGPAVTRLELETSPAAWGAREASGEHPAFDLLPHLSDLACMAKGEAPVAVRATCSENVADATLRFGDGSEVRCRAVHGGEYREGFAIDGRPLRVGPPGLLGSLSARVRRKAPVDVLGMSALLDGWARGTVGSPGVEDAWNSVAVVDAYWRSVESGREEMLELFPGDS